MKQPLSIGVLLIPVLSALAAAALVVLALMPGPESPRRPPEASAGFDAVGAGKPARLDAATPVPAPRPSPSPRQ